MKKSLLFFMLFALSVTLFAQTNTWTGAGDNINWNMVANWSLNAVPTALNDVVIPTGFTVSLNVAGTTKSIVVQGNSTLNIFSDLSFTNASTISANATVVWSAGTLTGGGTLTNNGTFNLPTTSNKFIVGFTTFNNAGTFNISDSGDLYINDGIFNNQSGGILDLQDDSGNITHNTSTSRVLNNSGVIKKTTSTGNAIISVLLNNMGGTISVESGNLIFNSLDKNLTNGIYDVVDGSYLEWGGNTVLSGTLTGVLNGELAWTGTVTVPVATTAVFDFTGNSGVSWSNGILTGSGTLVNNSLIFLPTTNNKFIVGETTLENQGMFMITDSGDLYINDGIFNNMSGAILDLQSDSGDINHNTSTSRVMNNSGIIKKTTSTGNAFINVVLNNLGGTISVESGNLIFASLDKNLTNGTYNVFNGSFLEWRNNTFLAGTLTGNLQGEVAWTGTVTVPTTTTAVFDFTGNEGVSWSNGNLTGGGTLLNNSLIYLPTTNNKFIVGQTTLENQDNFIINDSGDLYINDGIFNNGVDGILELREDSGNITHNTSASRILNNSGIIKKTNSDGNAIISVVLNNLGGMISVESGNLILNSLDKNLTNGIYDVVDGSYLEWGTNTILSGTLTGTLNGEIAWTNIVSVPENTTATLDFSGDSGVSWSNGSLDGGGTLVNNSLMFLPTTNNKFIVGMTTLSNQNNVIINDSGDLYINDGVFTNEVDGVLDLQADAGNITHNTSTSRVLNNFGLIKKTTSPGNVFIQTILNNNAGGIISVESGNLIFSSLDKNLTDGIYNVASGSYLEWNSTTVLAGTLTGNLDGEIAWTGTVTVPASTTAILDFTGDDGVSWSFGILTGGGTLVNKSLIYLPTTNNKFIIGVTTLSNEGNFNIVDTGDLYINDGIFNNEISGVLDLQSDAGEINHNTSTSRMLNNFGLLTKSSGTGTTQVFTTVNNSGIIDAAVGILSFGNSLGFTNNVDGIVKGIATINIPSTANFTNNGTFAPGGSPGTLSVNGNFESESSSVLDVELNGLTSGTQYDVLAITGTNAIFKGSVNVTLGFAADLNDEFVIATTTGTISQCELAPTASAEFEGMMYTFDVFCNNNNQVVLGVNNITLGVDEFELTESSIQLYPNPVRSTLNIKNVNNLELENGSIMDITGKVITSFNLKNMGLTKEISLENLSNGMYFVTINGLINSVTKRVVKH